ncbi:hypothetical protein DWW10_01045 [Bacteroides intestinalis]|uniref:Uncharacterized protein n=1 Tax=Bacteroides intestinalis TaxID=329854 RepID=A0A412YLH7_9BACE|nr:hypothetical protein DWW10_01045 [Bacteroides intestinalis]RHA63341.1 hypothetical protein DW932_01115 [Bacteroides intestinalis]
MSKEDYLQEDTLRILVHFSYLLKSCLKLYGQNYEAIVKIVLKKTLIEVGFLKKNKGFRAF